MKKLTALLLVIIMVLSTMTGCGNRSEETTNIRIGAMSGPTAMGMVKLMKDSEDGKTSNTYEFADLATDASAMVPLIATGELDIAAVPANLAATLYNNTEGQIQVLTVCALGVLSLVARGDSNISSMADLAGCTVYATGQGAVPEYTIRYILENNGINPDEDVKLIWCTDTTEALSYLTSIEDAIGILPQPFVTAACMQVEDLEVISDLNDEWDKLDAGCNITTGVIVARKEFVQKYPRQIEKFISEYRSSVDFTSTNTEECAELIVQYGIVPKAPLAMKALPGCHVVCITGKDLKNTLEGFLELIYEMNPKAVGGKMPGDDFYYGI